MTAPILSTCFACGVPTLDCICGLQPEAPEWRTEDGQIDPSKIGCPDCGEIPWCSGAVASAGAGWESLPELVTGTAPMAPRWTR